MKYENPRLKKINDARTSLSVIPPFEPYRNAEELFKGVKDYVGSFRRLWKQGFSLPRDDAEHSRKYYQELREALLSLGADISRLPRRLRIKTIDTMAA